MSKKEMDEHIIKIIENASSKGISLKELLDKLVVSIPLRTLQYRLSKLAKAGLLKREGNIRQSKYQLLFTMLRLKQLVSLTLSESNIVILSDYPFQML